MGSKVKVSKKTKQNSTDEFFPIIGVGTSAGGLEALEGFFSHMPVDCNMAFVIIQHLDPKHKSMMGSLLTKHTGMKVLEIEDGMKIETNTVYVIPPNRYVNIIKRKLSLIEPELRSEVRLPIDYFFRSLADEMNEKAIGVVLSGTGTDGTLGLKAIKEAGGMAMVQDETQAAYSGMPASAIGTGLVDFISAVENMADLLLKYVKHPYIAVQEREASAQDLIADQMLKILALIRTRTGNDFSKYKQTTIHRRIERRMAVHQIEKIADYYRFLQQTPVEVDTLFKDMLIGVTNFFRDPEAFQRISDKLLPRILNKKTPDAPVRVWVPGCATGEEAYSLAMLFVEAMNRLSKHCGLQIFATDIDADAIEYAREAVYPDGIAADVSPERLKRFFTKEEKTFVINKQIREMVVFAVQNLVKDPPFSKLDLVSCRNLLIYMGSDLQKKILPLFHFTLAPNGFLFLGPSESIGGFADYFSPLDSKWKIFQRKGGVTENAVAYSIPPFMERALNVEPGGFRKAASTADLKAITEKIILDRYAPASVLVDDKFDILYFLGQTSRYLLQPVGEPNFNLLNLVRKELRYQLNLALKNAARQKKMVTTKGVPVKNGDRVQSVNIVVRPLMEHNAPPGTMAVMFEETAPAESPVRKKKKKSSPPAIDARIQSLEQELNYTRESLQTTIEEMETSNEELKSTNEELQSTNEELQSTNEELETSKEELHSTNEELITLNAELQIKVDELEQVNSDINNLLASTEIGTLFLDSQLCIKRYTPMATKMFNLIKTDIDRPISDITSNLQYHDLYDDAKAVLDDLKPKIDEIKTNDGKWYSMHILPYRTLANIIDGVVITFVDISERVSAQQKAERAQLLAENIVDTVREPLILLDQDFRVISANRSFYTNFQVSERETLQKHIFELGNKQWDIPAFKKVLGEVLSRNKSFEDFKVEHNFPAIGPRKMLLNARRLISQTQKDVQVILLAIEDITD